MLDLDDTLSEVDEDITLPWYGDEYGEWADANDGPDEDEFIESMAYTAAEEAEFQREEAEEDRIAAEMDAPIDADSILAPMDGEELESEDDNYIESINENYSFELPNSEEGEEYTDEEIKEILSTEGLNMNTVGEWYYWPENRYKL